MARDIYGEVTDAIVRLISYPHVNIDSIRYNYDVLKGGRDHAL